MLVGATLVATALLAEAPTAHEAPLPAFHWTLWWTAVVLSFWSLVPQSPGGLWWAWAITDIAALLLALYLWPAPEVRLRWLWHTTARSLTWGGALLWSVWAGSAPFEEAVRLPGARAGLLTLILWRFLWSGPTLTKSPRKDLWERGGRLLLPWLFLGSTLPALFALAQWPASPEPWPSGFLFWGLSFIGAWTGLARWLNAPSLEAGFPGLVTVWGWMAVLMAWYGQPAGTLFWAGLPWLLGAAVVLFRLPEARLLPLWGLLAFTLTFWPITPGRVGVLLWLESPLLVGLWAGLVFLLSLLGGLPLSVLKGRALDHQPRWVQVFYPAGFLVLTVGLWRWGLSLPESTATPTHPMAWLVGPAWLLSAMLSGWYLWRHRTSLEIWSQVLARPLRFFLGMMAALYRGIVQAVEDGLYFLSLVFEGEGGLMWALAFLAALALFVLGR